VLRLRVRIAAALYARQIGGAHYGAKAPGKLLVTAHSAFERLGPKRHRAHSPIRCSPAATRARIGIVRVTEYSRISASNRTDWIDDFPAKTMTPLSAPRPETPVYILL
jgi:hypothetical protein